MRLFVPILCALLLLNSPCWALEQLDSLQFPYRYEGVSPLMVRGEKINLGAGYHGTLGGATLNSDAGHLQYETPALGGLMLRNPFWESDCDQAQGWTWEVRLRLDARNSERSFQVRLGDRNAGHSHLGLQFWPDRVQTFSGKTLIQHDFTSGFTTLRIASDSESDQFLLWLNGTPVAADLTGHLLTEPGSHWIGDGSAVAAGRTVIDYLRWTGRGAFAPARQKVDPPPSSKSTSPQPREPYLSRRRELPHFGLILNDDGDASFPSADPATARSYRKAMIDAFAGTPVKTLMVSVGMGSDTLYYPTTIADPVGWRKTRYDRKQDNPTTEEQLWGQRLTNIRNGMNAGIDPVREAAIRARKLGMRFVPSYRMNDDHFMFYPLEYPMTGSFWLEHHESLKIRDSPILSDPRYGQLLDFSKPQVRQFRLGIIREVLDRYADTMDGIELDFNRVQVFFPRGQAVQAAPLMTELVAEVRRRLDHMAGQQKRELYLFVRIPPTLKHCRRAGLEIEQWLERHLVDVLIPAQLMTLSHDMPLKEFVALAKPAGAAVYPAIYPRTGWMWPLSIDSRGSYTGPAVRRATPELFRGAAANYWAQGAAGFQLFNFRTTTVPQPDLDYRIMRDLSHPACLNQADRVFAVTPGYYLDYEDTYQERKQLPVALKSDSTRQLTLLARQDFDSGNLSPSQITLRLGLRGVSERTRITVKFNGHTVHDGRPGNHLSPTPVGAPASAPTHYFEAPLSPSIRRIDGLNEIAVSVDHDVAHLVECQLGQFYRPRPNAIFEP